TRVLITTSDGNGEWSTVGVGENVIAASWQALEDAFTYGLLKEGVAPAGADRSTHTLTVALRHTRGALSRLAATLNNSRVTGLSYAASNGSHATAEIQVDPADATRARAKLGRVVEVLGVTES
ncbi:hypothetical protein, partial [Streptomyces zaomyceticus]|uniref:hypothetical protein n=1 Tax=Streptomyces zaomyceticus TaxID=68286 RepID=UPI0033B8D36C